MQNTSEMIVSGLIEGLMLVWEIFKPYLIVAAIGAVVLVIIKIFTRKVVRFFSIVSGDTRRETKRKLEISDNVIDLISNVSDIRPTK